MVPEYVGVTEVKINYKDKGRVSGCMIGSTNHQNDRIVVPQFRNNGCNIESFQGVTTGYLP